LTSEKFITRFTVPKSAIDSRGHVNNVVYLQWCLDVAEAHWISKTTPSLRDQYIWYVLNHTISYLTSAFEGETLEVQTWVDKQEGAKSDRYYTITRLSDNKLIVEAKTIWCLLNGKTLRPTKITDEITTLFH
jgi:acyl-CoA thioester hydrolase